MHDWNNEHSMVFRCEAARKANETRPRRSRVMQFFQDLATRRSETHGGGSRIIVGSRRACERAAGGTAAASEPKIPEASARKAKRAKSEGASAFAV